jgi:hypothetical protein
MTKQEARRLLASTIAERVRDPAAWLLALRAVAERWGLDVSRCLPAGATTLDDACGMLVVFAAAYRSSVDGVVDALEAVPTAPEAQP